MFALNDIAILIAIQQLVTKYNSGYGALKFVRNSGLISVIVCGALDAAYITMPILRPVRRALSDFTSLFSVIALLLLLYLWVTSLPTARNWHRSAIIITSGFVALLETIVCGVHISHIPASFSSDHVAYSFTQMDTALALVLIVLYVFTAIHYFRNYRKTAMTNTVKRATFRLTIVTGSVMLTWLVVDITAYSYTTPLAHTAGHSMMLQILRGTFITIRQFVLILGFSMVVGRNYPASTPQSPRTPRINVIATGNYANVGSPSPISPVGTYTSRSGLSSPKKLYEDEMADFPHDSRFPAFPAFIPLHK
ncbi:hypothetical protein BDF19DRAFT_46658 [Syncephalis fuscata]|nr:hypothetical protein BDF19DRAFT_46658 [Syncephalis fuscata]